MLVAGLDCTPFATHARHPAQLHALADGVIELA
jgi:hypothetical protein